jgi:hypothetical protein
MCRSILSYRPEAGARALRHVFREDLLARVADDGEAVSRYRAALADIALRGAGSVLAVPADAAWLVARAAPEPDERTRFQGSPRCAGSRLHRFRR